MLKTKNIKKWFWLHKWSSLICTIFLLELCLTGLPLVFGDQINQWLNPEKPYVVLPANTPMANLDTIAHISQREFPKRIISYIFIDDDEPQIVVSMATSWKQTTITHSDSTNWIKFDARTATILDQSKSRQEQKGTFIDIMLELHESMFAGLFGELFIGFMGLLFVIAIVSGVVLYGPFMKKLEFGTIRNNRSRRLKWLDLHNLLGIVIGAWMLVVGATGVMNELATPLFGIWQMTDVKELLTKYKDQPVPNRNELSSVQAAFDTVRSASPKMAITSIVFPGAPFASSQHYLLWTKGNTPLTSRLFDPVLVNARTGKLDAVVKMPWYLRSLEVSRPLHFGDYGGMPLKILWSVFDIVTIIVLITGLILWFSRRKSKEE